MAASAFGMTAFGELNGNGDISLVTPTTGLIKALDVILAAHQLNAQNQITAWTLTTPPSGCQGVTCVAPFHSGFPTYVNDLQFLSGPAIADLTGDGRQEILQGSATTDLRAVQPNGIDLPGWSKNTGGWTANTRSWAWWAPGPRSASSTLTRDGRLFLGNTAGPRDAASWPKARHDLWNSGEKTDAAGPRPSPTSVAATGDAASLVLTAPHADLLCGNASGYEVRYSTTGPIDRTGAHTGPRNSRSRGHRHRRELGRGARPPRPGGQSLITVHGLPDRWQLLGRGPGRSTDAGRQAGNLGAISNNVLFNTRSRPGRRAGGGAGSPGGGGAPPGPGPKPASGPWRASGPRRARGGGGGGSCAAAPSGAGAGGLKPSRAIAIICRPSGYKLLSVPGPGTKPAQGAVLF